MPSTSTLENTKISFPLITASAKLCPCLLLPQPVPFNWKTCLKQHTQGLRNVKKWEMAMWKKKGTFTSIHATFDSYSFTEQWKLNRTPWCSALYLLWECTGWPVIPEDNQVPCFRRVFLTLHVMFSSMIGIHPLNSTASPHLSHQNFVLKEDDGLGADCTEKTAEIKTLSLSNRNDKEEKTVLDAYVEMTGS